jgi:glutathione S-transferase
VPVLVDGDRWIADSWTIANYLEDTFPDSPSLFGGASGRDLTRYFRVSVTALRQLRSKSATTRPRSCRKAVTELVDVTSTVLPFALGRAEACLPLLGVGWY